MITQKFGLVWTCVSSIALAACSSSNDKTNSGASQGPDGALASTECYLDLTLPDTSYSGYACSGTSQDSSVSAIGPKSWDDVRVTVGLSLNAPPAIGLLDIASLTIRIPDSAGNDATWDVPVDSCTANAVKSAVDSDMGWVYYRIDIDCTEPAVPAAGNPGQAMQLSPFTIVTFFAA